jgi:hypothetical protein
VDSVKEIGTVERKGEGGEEDKERKGRNKRKRNWGREKKLEQERTKQIKISTEWKKEINNQEKKICIVQIPSLL